MTPTKALSVVGVIQAAAVVVGTLFVTVYLKASGYGDPALSGLWLQWNPRSVWIRESGWLLIAVPLLWVVAMLWITRMTQRYAVVSVSGGLVLFGLAVFYLDAIINAYTRSMIPWST